MSRRIASTSPSIDPAHPLEIARVADVHGVGDRLHATARGVKLPVARYSGTTSLTLVAATNRAIGKPSPLGHEPRGQVAEIAARRATRRHATSGLRPSCAMAWK